MMSQYNIDQMTLLQRAAARTPKFFKKLQLVGATMIAATLGIFIGKENQVPTEQLAEAVKVIPPAVVSVATVIGAIGVSIVTLCQFAVETKTSTEQPPASTQ